MRQTRTLASLLPQRFYRCTFVQFEPLLVGEHEALTTATRNSSCGVRLARICYPSSLSLPS